MENKMKKQIILLVLGIFMINLVLGFSVCIDHDAPTWPENSSLDLSIVDNNNVYLEWTNATDVPECSGINHYTIYKGEGEGDLNYLETSFNNSFLDENLGYGDYTYMIHAYDKVGHNESNISLFN